MFKKNHAFFCTLCVYLQKATPGHKVHTIYLEYHSVCPLRIGTPPHPLSRKRVCPPRNQRGGHIFLRAREWGVPIRTTGEKPSTGSADKGRIAASHTEKGKRGNISACLADCMGMMSGAKYKAISSNDDISYRLLFSVVIQRYISSLLSSRTYSIYRIDNARHFALKITN